MPELDCFTLLKETSLSIDTYLCIEAFNNYSEAITYARTSDSWAKNYPLLVVEAGGLGREGVL